MTLHTKILFFTISALALIFVFPTVSKANVVMYPEIHGDIEIWIDGLEWCESGGNPLAVNPNDTDNTPSYGILQFKPSTFDYFSKKYRIVGELMDPVAQRKITRAMIDNGVDLTRQFPGCTRILGLPPEMI